MSRTKLTAFLLAVLFLFAAVGTYDIDKADAATKAEQQYFLDTVGPMCTADMRDNHILASFTMAQAIQESGWGTSTLAKEANALFGVRAGSRWDGMVYDRNEKVLYGSWDGLVNSKGEDYVKQYSRSFWRAYESWEESVYDRSKLFNTSSIYENLRGNYDYKSCAKLVVEDGYCSDPEYTETLIYMIEHYDLEKYNYDFGEGSTGTTPAEPDSSEESSEEPEYAESINIKANHIYTDVGVEYKLAYSITPGDAECAWVSSDSSVVSVNRGKLVAKKTGKATVTFSSGALSSSVEITVRAGYGCLVVDSALVDCVSNEDMFCVPEEAATIADGAFDGSRVQTVVVGSSVKEISGDAFDGVESGFSLCAYGNSAAAKYAANHSIDLINFASKWKLDSSYSVMSGIPAYTIADLVQLCCLADGYEVVIYDGNKVVDGTGYVGSGCKVVVNDKEYYVTVKGDTDGDGKYSEGDWQKLREYLRGKDSALPARAYRRAADMNEDSTLSTLDYLLMKNS